MHQNNKLTAAICAGPIVLEEAGIIEGRKVTSYPGFEDQLSGGIYQEEGRSQGWKYYNGQGPGIGCIFLLSR